LETISHTYIGNPTDYDILEALVFTKNRKMQLQAYLESFGHYCSGVDRITILSGDEPEYLDPMLYEVGFKGDVIYQRDHGGSFDKALRMYVDELDPNNYVLFGCDDVVYFKEVDLKEIIGRWHHQSIGFSLRLGTNVGISTADSFGNTSKVMLSRWVSGPSHYGYPFELMATMYKADLVKRVVESNPNEFRIPNDLESHGYHHCFKNEQKTPFLNMYLSSSCAAAMDLNRVQDLYQNKITASNKSYTPEKLNEMYEEGFRIDWKACQGIKPNDCFIGDKYVRFTVKKL
jgi:hypothetical protein